MRTLKSRLILSHILPLLIILPLVGLALLYILETQIFLTNLADQLQQQAALTADMAREQPDIWQDADKADVFVTRFSTYHQSQVTLLDPQGHLLASSNSDEMARAGQAIQLPNLSQMGAGTGVTPVHLTQNFYTQVTEVWVPVVDANQQVIGVVRMSNQLSGVRERFLRVRYIMLGALVVGLLFGAGIGLVLALDIERALQRVTRAIAGVARRGEWAKLPEKGPLEIRELLQAFNGMSERLQMLEDSRRRLLANLVHELGRPVGALQSGIQALINGAVEEPELREKLLAGMQAETRRLKPLLINLTNMHDRVLGTVELKYRSTELSDWLTCTIAPWREAARDKRLQWETSIPEDLPALTVDPDRLAQVVGNLLSNAIKYTSEGAISVAAGATGEDVWIRVSDTGPGIALEDQDRIFEPFRRCQTDRRFPQGMGLGLTIAKDLTTAHGGRLELDSQPGDGSRFTIRLPRQPVSQSLFVSEIVSE